MLSKIDFFTNKKFVLILADQINSRNLAYTGALIGFQFGRKVPEIVGRDQQIPVTAIKDGVKTLRTHHGITTQNLPVLNGLTFDNMRTIRENLRAETDLIITEVTDAVATCPSYDDYAKAIANNSAAKANYWGIGIYGDAEIINKYTTGLKLYGNQSKLPNPDTTIIEKRLVGDKADLPSIRLLLANNQSGGKLANMATILGVTYGKLYGDSIFGSDLKDSEGRLCLGLPMIELGIMNGHTDKNLMMRELREKLHNDSSITVVDVTNATGCTRCYEDYLKIAEETPPLDTVYWGLGLCGTSEHLNQYTAGLNLYITSSEEQALQKKQESAKKFEAKKGNFAPKKETKVQVKEEKSLGEAAVKGNLLWQQPSSQKVQNTQVAEAGIDAQQESTASNMSI